MNHSRTFCLVALGMMSLCAMQNACAMTNDELARLVNSMPHVLPDDLHSRCATIAELKKANENFSGLFAAVEAIKKERVQSTGTSANTESENEVEKK